MVSPSRLNLPRKKDGDQRDAAVLAVNSTLSHLHPTIFFLERSTKVNQIISTRAKNGYTKGREV